MRNIAFVFAAAVAALTIAAPAEATASLLINGTGQLIGASGVAVDGTTYDVAFLDGTCAALFGGCDATSDFNFTTQTGAVDAAQALLDQVFIDAGLIQFDSDPSRTFGCGDPDNCFVAIPYESFNGGFYANEVWNTRTTDYSNTSLTITGDFNTSNYDDHVYALFTNSVPEPATWAMMLLGFGAIGLATRAAAVHPRNSVTQSLPSRFGTQLFRERLANL